MARRTTQEHAKELPRRSSRIKLRSMGADINNKSEKRATRNANLRPPNVDATPEEPVKSRASTAFTCFLRLPVELRLKIWRYTFPRGRRVHLSYRGVRDDLTNPKDHGPLISLQINQESRTETLKQYCFISTDSCASAFGNIYSPPILLLANPDLDDLYLMDSDLHVLEPVDKWLEYVESRQNGFLSRITGFEYTICPFDQSGLGRSLSLTERPLGPLLLFSNLRWITLVVKISPPITPLTVASIEAFKENLSIFFKEHQRRSNDSRLVIITSRIEDEDEL